MFEEITALILLSVTVICSAPLFMWAVVAIVILIDDIRYFKKGAKCVKKMSKQSKEQ